MAMQAIRSIAGAGRPLGLVLLALALVLPASHVMAAPRGSPVVSRPGTCTGQYNTACSTLTTKGQRICAAQRGCTWSSSRKLCSGSFTTTCTSLTTRTRCQAAKGCTWKTPGGGNIQAPASPRPRSPSPSPSPVPADYSSTCCTTCLSTTDWTQWFECQRMCTRDAKACPAGVQPVCLKLTADVTDFIADFACSRAHSRCKNIIVDPMMTKFDCTEIKEDTCISKALAHPSIKNCEGMQAGFGVCSAQELQEQVKFNLGQLCGYAGRGTAWFKAPDGPVKNYS